MNIGLLRELKDTGIYQLFIAHRLHLNYPLAECKRS